MRKIQVANMIENSQFNKTHFTVLLWCILLILFDGYDLVVFSAVIPTLTETWGVSTTVLGMIGSLTLIGGLIGAQNLNNAFISSYFPSSIRSTALGTALSVGRIGAIIGPALGGFLLAGNLPVSMSFVIFAIPAFVAAITMTFVPLAKQPETSRIPPFIQKSI